MAAEGALVSFANMLGVFLRCLLYFNITENDNVKLEEHYTGKECDIRLAPGDYYEGTGVKNPNSLNGNPHYLVGYESYNSSLLYCARITSEMKCYGKVRYTLSVPANVLKGTITSIQVIDRTSPDKGGYVDIFKGGDVDRSAIFTFESLERKSMDYVVAIFGVFSNETIQYKNDMLY